MAKLEERCEEMSVRDVSSSLYPVRLASPIPFFSSFEARAVAFDGGSGAVHTSVDLLPPIKRGPLRLRPDQTWLVPVTWAHFPRFLFWACWRYRGCGEGRGVGWPKRKPPLGARYGDRERQSRVMIRSGYG